MPGSASRRLKAALARFKAPEIFNTDQGCQFTSAAFTDMLNNAGVRISMDGRGGFLDNVYIERLWRSLKYEEVYLHAFRDGRRGSGGHVPLLRLLQQQAQSSGPCPVHP
jgi:putative transposase